MIKVFLFLIVCTWLPSILLGQSNAPMTYNEMRNEVGKNILIFRIKTSSFFDNVQNGITDEINPAFLTLLPDHDYRLKLSFSKIDSMKYPLGQYDVYGIENSNYTYSSDSFEITRQYYDRGQCCSKYFLVAYDSKIGRVKYISGDFYKSVIAQDFSLNDNDPASFSQYIAFRLFNLGVYDLKFDQKTKYSLEYIGYSKELRSRIKIKIDRSDYEKIQVEQVLL